MALTCKSLVVSGLITASVVIGASLSLDTRPALAQAAASLEGSWSGSGTVTYPSGGSEAARCKASFRKQSGDNFAMNAICATPSGRVVQNASLSRISGNRFTGEFSNPEYGISGSINITIRGSNLTAAMSGGGASASFQLSK